MYTLAFSCKQAVLWLEFTYADMSVLARGMYHSL